MAVEPLPNGFVGQADPLRSEPHPLASLSGAEITTSSTLVKQLYPSEVDLYFKAITLQEPAKKDVVPYLNLEHQGHQPTSLARRSFVWYYLRNTVRFRFVPMSDLGSLSCSH